MTNEIEINNALRELGVTKFEQKSETMLQIAIGETQLLTVYIDKNPQKTLHNIEESGITNDLDAGILAKLKLVVARDYPTYLQYKEESKDKDREKDSKDKDQTSSAVKAVHLAKQLCEDLFLDNLGQPYAAIKVDEHLEVLPIKTEKFKDWLTNLYFDITVAEEIKKQEKGSNERQDDTVGDILSSEALIRVLRVLKAKAASSGKLRRELYLRVAKIGDTIYYDLANSQWQVVKITSEGWSIIYSPILFRRYAHQISQVIPVRGATSATFDELLKLLNISEDEENKLLFKCYIVTLFYYGIVHAALMLHGESGAAKTAKQEMVKMIVDPSEVLTLSISYDIESMAQKIAHNYVCFFDNISKIPEIIQDLLCRAITGTGFMKRELFTVDEEVIYKVKHALGLTGVNLAATKSDLIDRGLIIEHKPITNKKRLVVIWDKFETLRPKLLGHIFDILVKVLKYEKEHPRGLELVDYPRLADFTEVGEIASRCMGYREMAFVDAFEANIDSRHRKIIDDSSVGQALEIFVRKQTRGKWENGQWKGTMSELLPLLKEIAKDDLHLESVKNNKYWPQLAHFLSRRINEINPSLRAIGIDVDRTSDNSNKEYTIKRNKKYTPCIADSTKTATVANQVFETTAKSSDDNAKLNTNTVGDASATVATFFQTTKQDPISNKKIAQILGTYLAFDFEWSGPDNVIEAVSFVDSNGQFEVKLRNRDFGGIEADLLKYINQKLFSYQWSIGWNTQGNPTDAGNIKICDLSILHQRCKANSVSSLVELRNKGVPYLGYDSTLKHIDLCNVYRKAMVKDGMYNNYRTNKLDEVAKALLGYGKYKGHSGADFNSLPVDEQEKYSLVDSQLVMELSKHNDFEVLDAMFAISEIADLDFERVCRTNLSTWWGAIFDKQVKEGNCPPLTRREFEGTYKGAQVLSPKKGLYNNIVVVDAKSLYPSVGINYNLSFETINCNCCKDNPDAKLGKIIPDKFTLDCKFVNPATDWICRQHDGAFPTKLKLFKAERLKQKDLGNKAKQHALKILINGGYGVYGNKEYSYYDPRVAELVTAAGRYMLLKCKILLIMNMALK